MANITCSTTCTAWIDAHAIPTECGAVDFGFPKMLIFAAPDTAITVASDVPTYAEFVTAGSDIFIINDIANGVKMAGERQEISGADTPDNLPEVISEIEGISGNIVRFDADVYNDLEKLNCFKRLRMWYVTNKNYCFGGKTGYWVNNYFPAWTHDGFGNRSKIPFEFKWYRPEGKTTDTLQSNTTGSDYLDLHN